MGWKRIMSPMIILLLFAPSLLTVSAISRTWVAGATQFDDPNSWVPSGSFSSSDDLLIENLAPKQTIFVNNLNIIVSSLVIKSAAVALSHSNVTASSGVFVKTGTLLLYSTTIRSPNVSINSGSLFAKGAPASTIDGSLSSNAGLVAIGNMENTALLFGLDGDSQNYLLYCATAMLLVSEKCNLENGTTLSVTFGPVFNNQTNETSTYYSQLRCEQSMTFNDTPSTLLLGHLTDIGFAQDGLVTTNGNIQVIFSMDPAVNFSTVQTFVPSCWDNGAIPLPGDPITIYPGPEPCRVTQLGGLLQLVSDCNTDSGAISCPSAFYTPPACIVRIAICPQQCVHGQCQGDPSSLSPPTCNCSSALWTGADCSLGICPGSPPCGGAVRGVCNSTGEVPFCSCTPSFTGSDCSTPICSPPCDPATQFCSGFLNVPTCVSLLTTPPPTTTAPNQPTTSPTLTPSGTTLQPTCDPNFTGADCSIPVCNGNAQLSCSGQGICKIDQLPHYCVCSIGFTGANCEELLCNPACVNGKCTAVTGTPLCECFTGWTGAACAVSANDAIQNLTVTATAAAHKKKKSYVKTIAVAVGCAVVVLAAVGAFVAWRFHGQVRSMWAQREPDAYVQMGDR